MRTFTDLDAARQCHLCPDRLTTEAKWGAILNLTPAATLIRRCHGNWYVNAPGREIKRGAILDGAYGNGTTPDEAVDNDWKAITELAPGETIILDSMKPTRRSVEWTGSGWRVF